MTHITQEKSLEILEQATGGFTSFQDADETGKFASMVIDHYLSTLSAELPEPVAARWPSVPGSHHYAGAGGCKPGSFGEDSEDLFTSNQLLSALAARDAKWQGEVDALKQRILDLGEYEGVGIARVIAERDAALQDANRWKAAAHENAGLVPLDCIAEENQKLRAELAVKNTVVGRDALTVMKRRAIMIDYYLQLCRDVEHDGCCANRKELVQSIRELVKESEAMKAERDAALANTKEVVKAFTFERNRAMELEAELAALKAQKPVAWLYTSHAGDVQAFTNEPPPRLKELCIPLYATPVPAQSVNAELVEALEKLARLGNGDQYGNSVGNEIARAALAKVKEPSHG